MSLPTSPDDLRKMKKAAGGNELGEWKYLMVIHGLSVKKLKEKFNWLEVKRAALSTYCKVSTGTEARTREPLPVQRTPNLIIMAHAASPFPRPIAASSPGPRPNPP